MVIDFTGDKKLLVETWTEMLGAWSKTLLNYMYGNDVKVVADITSIMKEEDQGEPEFVIRGRYKDVKAYAQALSAEKNYLDSYVAHGPDAPQTIKTREILNQAVQIFENNTGIQWPFKDEE